MRLLEAVIVWNLTSAFLQSVTCKSAGGQANKGFKFNYKMIKSLSRLICF